ncbi:pentapeptide repeat-containing protein [Actinomyces slackii]|uniref:Pentapeptide repeat-containing protein n=1 Tax=Actinomyces slackii TaxID=52774 RepID=A0A3S4TCL4_9ACTO|nr:pentapeptide repeat-containing protein [Actinomyces slackii]VEG74776.1 Uncharacterised protein [Actinomyces slackii]
MTLTALGGISAIGYLVIKFRERSSLERGEADEKLSAAVEQLGSESPQVRIAGVHALTNVADTYGGSYNQRVVDILCGYLRTDRLLKDKDGNTRYANDEAGVPDPNKPLSADGAVESTILNVIAEHLRSKQNENKHKFPVTTPGPWSNCLIDIHGAKITENLKFRRTYWHSLDSTNTTFAEAIDISGAEFMGECNFKGTRFYSDLNAHDATFRGMSIFDSCQFQGETNFARAEFCDYAGFAGSNFDREVYFNRSKFYANSVFISSYFHQETQFGECEFTEETEFESAMFYGAALFARSSFQGKAFFYRTHFAKSSHFDGTIFTRDARFTESVFTGECVFRDATFYRHAFFGNVKFLHDCSFDNVTFARSCRFDSSTFMGVTRFDGSIFYGDTSFEEIGAPESPTFFNATFSEKRFSQSTFPPGTPLCNGLPPGAIKNNSDK